MGRTHKSDGSCFRAANILCFVDKYNICDRIKIDSISMESVAQRGYWRRDGGETVFLYYERYNGSSEMYIKEIGAVRCVGGFEVCGERNYNLDVEDWMAK